MPVESASRHEYSDEDTDEDRNINFDPYRHQNAYQHSDHYPYLYGDTYTDDYSNENNLTDHHKNLHGDSDANEDHHSNHHSNVYGYSDPDTHPYRNRNANKDCHPDTHCGGRREPVIGCERDRG